MLGTEEPINSQFRIDLSLESKEQVFTFLDSLAKRKAFTNFKYYVSFEVSAEVHKAHWQGWCTYIGKENTYRALCSKWAQSLSLTRHQSCFGIVKTIKEYMDYIMCSDEKPYLDHGTNYSSDELDVIKSERTRFKKKSEFLKEKKERKLDYFSLFIQSYQDKMVAFNGKESYPTDLKWVVSECTEYTVNYFTVHSKCHDNLVIVRFITSLISQYYPKVYREFMGKSAKKKVLENFGYNI